ncbi:DUF6677 family protein [Schlesneria paludicola]|uniref:DUF6677 family protein n=1 Tax=Schlesneria paludicola TaxID=360056 RepID=UPI00029B33D8|nr:DUF6677 family protein [Schlesneria paludicola]
MPTDPPAAHRKLWEERSVVVALILAVLVPGLGHLYQGRTVKGCIYLFGILGLFLWGVKLGEGVVVYNLPDKGSRRITLHYAAQLGAGAVAYPGLWQPKRAAREENHSLRQLAQPMTASFSGRLTAVDNDTQGGKLEGKVNFKPEKGEYGTETRGTFTGTLDGQAIELPLAGGFFLERPIGAGFRRILKCGVVGDRDSGPGAGKMITGTIPRSIMDGYGVPPDMDQLQEVTGRLGKLHELALVFTWIAGLLNVLAIWDCVQGPAYGFGDEAWSPPPADDEANATAAAKSAALNSAATST